LHAVSADIEAVDFAPPSISLNRPVVVATSRQASIEAVSAIAAPAAIPWIGWVLDQFALVKPITFDLCFLNGEA